MQKDQIIQNWLLKVEKDVETAKDLFKLKHYDWSLFIWHLALEKILKIKLIAQNLPIVYTHNLARLGDKAEVSLSTKQIQQLNEITTFNLEARYDDYKLSFYQKATKEYAARWTKICKSLYIYFKKNL